VRSHAKAPSAGSSWSTGATPSSGARMSFLGLALVAAFLLTPSSALAVSHNFLETFGSAAQPSFTGAAGMAIDQSSGDLLVIDNEAETVSRYNEDGTPANFSALGTNVIDGTAGGADETPQGELSFGSPGEVQIAIDNSGGPNDGNIYVPQARVGPLEEHVVNIFGEDGTFLGQLTESSEGAFTEPCGVAVDPSGSLYVGDFSGQIHKYEPAASPPVNGDSSDNFPFAGNCTLAAGAGSTEGFLFAAHFLGSVAKLNATTGAEEYEVNPLASTITLSVDPSTGHLFTTEGEEIAEYSAFSTTSAREVSRTPLASTAFGVAVNGTTENFYATREAGANVEVFEPITGFSFLETFGSAAQPTFTGAAGMAIDQSSGDLLVIDNEAETVSRYNEDGTPANFSALGTNVIDGTAGGADETPQGELSFGSPGEVQIAIDNSGGPNDGNIYVPQARVGPLEEHVVNIFGEDGTFLGQLTESSEGAFTEPCGVAVDPSGSLYVGDFSGQIHKYEPAASPPVNGDSSDNFPFAGNCTLAAGAGSTEGFLFAAHFLGSVAKLNATTGAEEYEVNPLASTITLSVDPSTGHLFTTEGEEIAEYSAFSTTSAREVSRTPLASTAFGVAVDGTSENFYATREASANVEVFERGGAVEFELSVEKTGNGTGTVTSTPPGIDCGLECSAEFAEGEVVELEATPASDSEFTGWSTVTGDPGTCTGTTSPCEVTMSEAVELEAEFALKPPSVTGLNPTEGPTAGGNTVTIEGTDLEGASEVKFGTAVVDDEDFLADSNTEIEVEAPSHIAGVVDVRVVTAGGESANTPADDYTYVEAPAVSAINPSEGATAGGNAVTITGTDLIDIAEVKFGAAAAPLSTLVELSPTEIEIDAPGHSAGTFDVIVSTVGGSSADTSAVDYTYVAPPAVTGLSPAKGPIAGGNEVEITGLRLSGASKVEFGAAEVACPSLDCTLQSATTINVNAPAHAAGKVNVRVTTLGGTSGNFSADDYTYEAPLPPPPGPEGGGGGSSGGASTSQPPPAVQCVVPRLKGLRPAKARSALADANCKTGELTKPKPRKGKRQGPLVVKSSLPGAGAVLPADSKVDLRLGPKPSRQRGGGR
jgi:hypothetical protein